MTTMQRLEPSTEAPPPSGGWLARAWISAASIPVFFFVSFALGYILYDALGYRAEDNNAPLWVDLFVAVVTLAVALVPCAGAVVYGRRCRRSGDRRGLLPLAIGAIAGVALTVLTVVTTVADAGA